MSERGTKERRPMTDVEYERAMALSPARVSYVPGTGPKRFARDMRAIALGDRMITDKQAEYLELMAWRFRRQIPPQLVPPFDPQKAQAFAHRSQQMAHDVR